MCKYRYIYRSFFRFPDFIAVFKILLDKNLYAKRILIYWYFYKMIFRYVGVFTAGINKGYEDITLIYHVTERRTG